jgi:hypothetical protein
MDVTSQIADSEGKSLFFTARIADFKKAVAYYHESLNKKSRILSYFHHIEYPSGTETMILKFKKPLVLQDDDWPKPKSAFVVLKLCAYCRDYEGHYEI